MATLNITPAAAEQIQRVLDERGQGLGLRVSVKPSGCSGYSYVLDFADEARKASSTSRVPMSITRAKV